MKSCKYKVNNGVVELAISPKGIKSCDFHINGKISADKGKGKFLNKLKKDFRNYFLGKKVKFNYKLDLNSASDFQKKVWKEAVKIPYGKTASYKDIAAAVGNPRSSRAVGNALNKNPLMILIPCHRVINSNGRLGGFSKGLRMKKFLLNLERVRLKK